MKKFYESLNQFIYTNNLNKIIDIFNSILTCFFYLVYVLIILNSLFQRNQPYMLIIGYPALTFILVTIIRKTLNFKRPFEVLAVKPVKDHKAGESFPSRHVTSAMAIALVMIRINLSWGIGFIILVQAVAILRICSGVHFIRDIAAGELLAIGMFFLLLGK